MKRQAWGSLRGQPSLCAWVAGHACRRRHSTHQHPLCPLRRVSYCWFLVSLDPATPTLITSPFSVPLTFNFWSRICQIWPVIWIWPVPKVLKQARLMLSALGSKAHSCLSAVVRGMEIVYKMPSKEGWGCGRAGMRPPPFQKGDSQPGSHCLTSQDRSGQEGRLG